MYDDIEYEKHENVVENYIKIIKWCKFFSLFSHNFLNSYIILFLYNSLFKKLIIYIIVLMSKCVADVMRFDKSK